MLGSFLHSVRYGFFDMFTQFYLLYTGKQETFNYKRATTFFIFGACFSVYYDYVFYSRFYVFLQKSWGIHPLGLVFLENTFTAPLLWCPTFYWVQEFIELDSPSLASAWETTKKNMVGDIKALYAVWGPFHLISFMFIQPMMRPAFAATVGIIWTVGWSVCRGDIAKNQADGETEVVGDKQPAIQAGNFKAEGKRKNLLPGDDVRLLPPVVETGFKPDGMKELIAQAEADLGIATRKVVSDSAQPQNAKLQEVQAANVA